MEKGKKNTKDKKNKNDQNLKRDFVSYAEIEAEKMSKKEF